MWPPIGLRPSAPAKREEAPGSDWTWLVFLIFDFLVSRLLLLGGRGYGEAVGLEGGEKRQMYHQDADVEFYPPRPHAPRSQQSAGSWGQRTQQAHCSRHWQGSNLCRGRVQEEGDG